MKIVSLDVVTRRVALWMFGGVALFGAGTSVLGQSAILPLSLAALVLMGAGDMVSVHVRHLLVQLETPTKFAAGSAQSIRLHRRLQLTGEFESGVTAGWFGLVPAVLPGRALRLGVPAAWMWRLPTQRTMDRFPRGGDSFCRQALTTPSYAVGAYASAKLSL